MIESQVAKATFGAETVLEEDTEWATAYYIFTVKETLSDESAAEPVAIGIHPGYHATYYSYLALDNLSVSEVSGIEYNDDMWDYLESIGMPAINYAIAHGSDYSGGTATVDSILNVLLNKEIKDGSIIIGHSTKEDCVVPDALAIALPILYEQGYRFCTLSQLFELQGIDYEDIPTGKYIKGVTVTDGVVEYRY